MTSVFSYIDIVVFTLSSFYFLPSFFVFFLFLFVKAFAFWPNREAVNKIKKIPGKIIIVYEQLSFFM